MVTVVGYLPVSVDPTSPLTLDTSNVWGDRSEHNRNVSKGNSFSVRKSVQDKRTRKDQSPTPCSSLPRPRYKRGPTRFLRHRGANSCHLQTIVFFRSELLFHWCRGSSTRQMIVGTFLATLKQFPVSKGLSGSCSYLERQKDPDKVPSGPVRRCYLVFQQRSEVLKYLGILKPCFNPLVVFQRKINPTILKFCLCVF